MERVWLSAGKYLVSAGILFLLSSVVHAAQEYDFYSWPNPDGTKFSCYIAVPTSTSPVVAADLKASKDAVCGKNQAKNLMLNLPSGAALTWKEDKDQGLILPSMDAVRQIQSFASQAGRKLTLPDTSTPRPNP